MAFRKIEAGLVQSSVDNFIGKRGTLFYDVSDGVLRISDGTTPGGTIVSGGAGGDYTLPTATTTVKGGVKIDGTTIAITNQVIRVGTVPYSSLSGTPTIPTNNNELTNGAAYITSAALSGLATETYVTSRGYITGLSWNQLTDKPNLAGTYQFSVAADDSTQRLISTDEVIKFTGAGGITTSSDAEGNITITQATTSSLVNGANTVSLSSAGVLTVPANGIITAPNAQEFQLQAKAADSVLRNEINLDPNNGTYMSVWSEELSTSFSLGAGSWVTGSWQKPGGFGAAYFTGAEALQNFWTTGPGSFVESVEVSINGGARGRAGYEGNNGGGSGVELSVDRIPVSSPTAITSLVFYYRTKNRFDIDYLNGQLLLNTQSMNINLETNSYINLKSTRANPVRIITNNNTHIWEFAANGKLTLPNGSTIGDGEAGFGVPITTARGTILLGNLAECAGGENHFHIMPAGQQAIDLFLGDDSNYVKLPSTGGVEISSSEIGAQHYWAFGSDGDLTVPGDIKSTANTSIIIDGGVLFANVTVQSVDSLGGGVWRMFISSSAYPTLGTIVQVGDTATLAWNNSVTATITSIVQDIGAGTWALHTNQNLITEWYQNPDARRTTINSTQVKTWTFGTDSRLIFPDNTVQSTAWTGVADYNNLINKPNLAGTYQFSVAADDSTQRLISTDEVIKFTGAGGITTSSDAEGNITITGPSLTGYATETFVTTRGYLTSVGTISYNDLTDKPNLASTYTFNVAADDSTLRTIGSEETVKFIGAGGITTSSDAEGAITITQATTSSLVNGTKTVSLSSTGTLSLPNNGKISSGVSIAQVGSRFSYATDAFGSLYNSGQVFLPADTNSNAIVAGYTIVGNSGAVTLTVTSATFVAGSPNFVQVATTPTASSFAYPVTVYSADYVAGYSAPEWQFSTDGSLTFPNGTTQTTAAESFSFSVAADDSTQRAISNNELIKFIGAGGITTASDTEGAITITQSAAAAGTLTGNTLASGVTASSLTSVGTLTGLTSSGTVLITNITASQSTTTGALQVRGGVGVSGNIYLGGGINSTGAIYSSGMNVTYAPENPTGQAFQATGKDTQGGTGYFDFFKINNTTSGGTNGSKTFRLNSTGAIEIINSAYSETILSLTDAGAMSAALPYQVAGKQAVNGPAFSAYAAAILQTISNGTLTKVLFQTEEFDTNSNYASSTFTPTVEGYYQLNAEVRLDGASGTGEMMIMLYKNGVGYKRGTNQQGTQIAANFWAMQVSTVVYANGTTDYFEIYVQQGSGGSVSVTAVNSPAITWFNGCMLRGA